jgi:dihydrofolate synthase/folylpolyglutamate synthase
MGGRFDATNAVDGSLAIITPVSLDHCEYLGATVAEIAGEKGGIIRSGRPLVLARQEPTDLQVLRDQALAVGAVVYAEDLDFAAGWGDDNNLHFRGLGLQLQGLHPGIGGRFQSGNVACALAGAELLQRQGVTLPSTAFATGIATAHWPGRMELFPGVPRLLLDGAHNPAGAQALAAELATLVYDRLILTVGVMGDKDGAGILASLLPLADEVVAVASTLDRALPADELAAQICSAGARCRVGGTVANGLAMAQALAGPDDLVVVCGSLFVVGEARAMVTGQRFEPIRG